MDVTTDHAGSTSPEAAAAMDRRGRVRVGAVVAVAVAVGLSLWLVLRNGGSSSPPPPAVAAAKAVPISVRGLHSLAALGIPIYWAGERAGSTLEMTKTADNRVFLRYLPAGGTLGTRAPYLTIGSYPMRNAFATTRRLAQAGTSVTVPVGHGGVAFYSRTRPTNVYLAYPGSAAQIEVYDPSPEAARQLVFSGQVVSAGPGASSRSAVPRVVSTSTIAALAASLRHPLYWAGAMPGVTYELTQTWSGNVFVRYLPEGTAIGSKAPCLTVATYPVLDALAAVRRAAKSSTAHTIHLPRGGLAVVDDRDPKRVYLAYPKSDYQVEVFDPLPGRARAVASRRIESVG